MISKKTAAAIFNCYSEIEKCDKLTIDLKKELADSGELMLKNAFGDRCGLQLGVPCGENSHRLYDVPPELAVAIIGAHKEQQEKKLLELKAIATVELK